MSVWYLECFKRAELISLSEENAVSTNPFESAIFYSAYSRRCFRDKCSFGLHLSASTVCKKRKKKKRETQSSNALAASLVEQY